jgi:hypothetical protein
MTDSPLYWHIHHDILLEPLTEPIENRIQFIKVNKPKNEVETRLRLMKPVRGKLPKLDKACAEWGKACAEWGKARAEWDKACAEWDKARAEWDKACADPKVLALHAKECPDCPWDGRTIFPEART